jgi:hypothetical protein
MDRTVSKLGKQAKVAWAAYFRTHKKLKALEGELDAHKEYVLFLEEYVEEMEEKLGVVPSGGWYIPSKKNSKKN